MNKAVLYARVSSDLQQKERTIESQIEELKKQIVNADSVLVKEYIDDGYSGAQLDRPAMNQLRNDLKTNLFNTIYFLNTDRIARDVTYQNIIIGEILKYKKQIIINGKDYIHNPENKFTLTVLGAVSELERAKLIERIMRGRQYRLKQGVLLGQGYQIYGYTYKRKTAASSPSYVINEEEARVVQNIFETYAKGQIGIRTIVRHLENIGVQKTKDRNQLNQTQIKYILRNETYTGVRYFNTMTDRDTLGSYRNKRGKQMRRDRSDWVGVKIPAVISKELFDNVQARLAYNRTCYRNAKQTQLLSNLVWCGKCGSRCFAYRRYYQVQSKYRARLYQRAVYRCKAKGTGHNPEIDTRILESCVIDMIKDTLLNPMNLHECIGFFKNKRVNSMKIEKQLKGVDEKIRKNDQRKKRIIDLYASGDLEREEYVKRITAYENEVAVLKSKHDELTKYTPLFQKQEAINDNISEYCTKAKTQFETCSDFESKRQFVLDHVTKVAYHRTLKGNDKVRLHGSLPLYSLDQPTEAVTLEFKIERVVNRAEILTKVREMDLKEGTWGGIQMQSMEYGKLVTAKKPEMNNI